MADKDLDETKPIKILKDLTDSRSDRYDKQDKEETRSEKYEDVLIEEEAKIQKEEAEEALAEKNIAKAEALLEEEKDKKKKKKVEEDDDEDDEITEDDGLLGKLIVNWRKMPKKKKVLIVVSALLVLLLVIVLIIFLVLKFSGEEEKPVIEAKPKEEEVVPVIVDNFYYKDGKLYFLAEDDSEIGSYECENKDDKLCYVDTNEYLDSFDVVKLVDKEGKALKQRLPIYENNYVFVFDNKSEDGKEIILYSIKDEKEVGRYNEVKAFSDNYIIVQDTKGLYGLIQIQNGVNEIIAPQYSYLGMIDGEANLVAKNKNGYIVINKKNKAQSSQLSSGYEIKYYNDKFVVVLVSDRYNVYDYEGNSIVTDTDFATLVDDYVGFVNNSRLYFVDGEVNKYTENGVKLNTSSYVKTYVYDENNELTETKRSFEVIYKDNSLEVGVYTNGSSEPKNTIINLLEGKVNKKYEYINYFDGKLYIYEDLEKIQLLGFYTCKNANVVTSADAEYNTCFLAKDNIIEDNDMIKAGDISRKSLTPIIRNRYIFVSDGSNNVTLYDLESKTILGDYSKVNTYTANNNYKVTHYGERVNVVALNKKGLYGLLTIDENGVNVKYTFKYNSFEKLGNDYLVLDTSNNWRVLYNSSESPGFTDKIRGYNVTKKYYKVLEGSKYYVYDSAASKVVKDGYSYVELYDTYYAAVNDSKEIDIYDYSGNKLNTVGVKVGDYKYYGVDNPAFYVEEDGSDYVAYVWDGSKYNETSLTESGSEPDDGASSGSGDNQ